MVKHGDIQFNYKWNTIYIYIYTSGQMGMS